MFPSNLSRLWSIFLLVVTIHSGICQNPEENGVDFEGDILGTIPIQVSRSGRLSTRYRWSQATVPYVFDPAYPHSLRQTFHRAISHISSRTCIRFRPRTQEQDFLYITEGNGDRCASYIGRQGRNQTIYLPRRCMRMGTFVHELIHSLGFHHEQARTDRNMFVKINWENIPPGKEVNFRSYGMNLISSFGVGYDYASIMHYSKYSFSRSGREPTIEPLQAGVSIGQRQAMSEKDVAKIDRMYC